MSVTADDLKPLKPAAAAELARQINAGVGDAKRLVEESHWSWNLAFVLARAISGEGPSGAAYLASEGIPPLVARAVANACAAVAEKRHLANVEASRARVEKHRERLSRGVAVDTRRSYRGTLNDWSGRAE